MGAAHTTRSQNYSIGKPMALHTHFKAMQQVITQGAQDRVELGVDEH